MALASMLLRKRIDQRKIHRGDVGDGYVLVYRKQRMQRVEPTKYSAHSSAKAPMMTDRP